MTDKESQNRKRCLQCKYYGMNVCPLMADVDVFNLDICILDVIDKKNWNEDSPEIFMFRNSPTLLLSYLTFLRKDKLPKIGDKVLTLHGGYNSFDSRILYVSEITDKYIELVDFFIQDAEDEWEDCDSYLSYINEWYKDLFVFDENN